MVIQQRTLFNRFGNNKTEPFHQIASEKVQHSQTSGVWLTVRYQASLRFCLAGLPLNVCEFIAKKSLKINLLFTIFIKIKKELERESIHD